MSQQVNPDGAYYYNLGTGQVEHGLQSDWTDRLGPYDTEEQARNALGIAAARNAQWDAADEAWEGDEEADDAPQSQE